MKNINTQFDNTFFIRLSSQISSSIYLKNPSNIYQKFLSQLSNLLYLQTEARLNMQLIYEKYK